MQLRLISDKYFTISQDKDDSVETIIAIDEDVNYDQLELPLFEGEYAKEG